MKQSAAKTLGVAALGAAFAAVGTGAANAAPAVPDTSKALDTVTRTLPAQNAASTLPGSGKAVTKGKSTRGTGRDAAQSAAKKKAAAEKRLAGGPTTPVGGLLGGLPLKGLPVVNGLPLG
ncbi:ATP-binding protein [Streptomyces sp. SD15]